MSEYTNLEAAGALTGEAELVDVRTKATDALAAKLARNGAFPRKSAELLNGIALAYIGDAVYEVFVREHLLASGLTRPNDLQKQATHFVSAKAQAAFIAQMEQEYFLTNEELVYFKRGRNAHPKTTAKNTDVLTYRISTGFEAVVGYLYLTGQTERLHTLWSFCLQAYERL